MIAKVEEPDPAAILGAACSIRRHAELLAGNHGKDLSAVYNGNDEFMRICMTVAVEFEQWACEHVQFDQLDEVWPYLLDDKFGEAAIEVAGSECELGNLNGECWDEIARNMGVSIRESESIKLQ